MKIHLIRMTYVVLNGAETTIFDFFLLLNDSCTRELGFDQFSVKVYICMAIDFRDAQCPFSRTFIRSVVKEMEVSIN